MGHGAPFTPTFPHPQTEHEKRVYIAEARAYNHSGYMIDEKTAPLPELYHGHYEDLLGLTQLTPSDRQV